MRSPALEDLCLAIKIFSEHFYHW